MRHPLHHRYGIVLGLILLSISFELAAPVGGAGWRVGAVALEGGTLVAAVIASRSRPYVVYLAIGGALFFVAGATVVVITSDEFGSDAVELINLSLVVLASPAILAGMVRHFREEDRLTLQSMFGALALYLLIGLGFASADAVVQAITNTPFFATGAGDTQDFIYFSFTTITTTGYGDLTAATNFGRSLAITEALTGQIYLVTVVAMIVGNLRARPGPGGR